MSPAAMLRPGHNAPPPSAADILQRRLANSSFLSGSETDLIRSIAAQQPRQQPAHSELCGEGRPCPARFIVSGWACCQRTLADGRRQIVSFTLPGDLIGPIMRPRLASVYATVSLTEIKTVDCTALGNLARVSGSARPGIVRALTLMDCMGDVLLRNQIVRLGRQTAYERMLHLLLEFRDRLLTVGLAERDSYALPLTQEVLADALGLSTVHVNRTLQQIRRDGMVELRGGTVLFLKPELAEATAEWHRLPDPVD